jgi:hypothetical protein
MHSVAVQLSSLRLRGELGIVPYRDHVRSSRGAMEALKVTRVKDLSARKGEAWGISS